MKIMKQLSKIVVLISLLIQSTFLLADIYRSEDSKGNVSFSDQPSANAKIIEPAVQTYRYKHQVKKVYDGDTITLANGDRVRLLGINTPEIENHQRQGEAGGQIAKKWLQDKLQQGQVYLEYDHEKQDKYDRLLANLFLPDGEHINKVMLESGLATLSIIPPNVRYAAEFQQAQLLAEQQGLGLWAMPEYQPRPVATLSKENNSGWQRFLATPQSIKQGRTYVRLVLTEKVDIRIPKANLDLFPELTEYLNKPLEIRGWASRSKDTFSILVRHPSAIIYQ